MNKKQLASVAAVAVTAMLLPQAATAVPIYDGETIMGFTDVTVNGVTYDVDFQDGHSATLFENGNNIMFDSVEEALSASEALWDQIVLFDLYDELSDINGIDHLTPIMITPYGETGAPLTSAYLYTTTGTQNYQVGEWVQWGGGFGSEGHAHITFADWGNSTAIPTTGTAALFALGLAGLATSRRKKKAQAV